MAKFRLKLSADNEVIVRAKADQIDDFDDVFAILKKKFRGERK